MSSFSGSEIVVRVACRGTALFVPDRDALCDACGARWRDRVQASLVRHASGAPVWALHWLKAAGDRLRPGEVVARLRGDEFVVELICGQGAKLAETLVPSGAHVAPGAALARLERRAKQERRSKATGAAQTQLLASFSQFTVRQMQDAEVIAALRNDLDDQRRLTASLRAEIAFLRAQGSRAAAPPSELKFRRIKQEFSKHFHPDAQMADDVERHRRAGVFREFWPVVEAIERS